MSEPFNDDPSYGPALTVDEYHAVTKLVDVAYAHDMVDQIYIHGQHGLAQGISRAIDAGAWFHAVELLDRMEVHIKSDTLTPAVSELERYVEDVRRIVIAKLR